ncbi:aminotransferase class V-fold PLP-dependent enzyme [Amylibacter sp. SFDW26]|uniref:aminotransferase class V-fold PLP-dependent enzyme n=1 Tax=Amylibacter sp. SFDW26 TaxID=2652722 RepID=UPI0012623E0E|nr:aminotransferase class V-fold PLP-dependent enzyme [Amylibacter sp. SFDW26]KAB7616142.1 aminotransferase class V-fold PLP-dependent enzyme [Amylibacter sp. SFDW26]
MLDIEFVRKQFPAFSSKPLTNQAFFENAGGSYTCRQVIDRLSRYYIERKVQPYSAYEASRLAGEEMDEARKRLSAIMGIEQDELSFGPSTTQNTYVLAQAFADYLHPGQAIIVTNQDHEANSGPWRRLADRGVEIREWKIDPDTGHLDILDLISLLDDKVKLVCFPHCSNVVGEVNDVPSICRVVHAAGAVTCVDGVSYAPHGIPDVGALGADIYMFSAYKTYGPHQGIMAIKRELGERLPNQGHYFNAGSLYKRFTPAGPDHAQIAACAGMADYVDALYEHHQQSGKADAKGRGTFVHDLMRAQEVKLLQPLLDYLGDKNSVRMLGPRDANIKAPTVAVSLERRGEEVAAELASHGIMAGGGDFYGVRCLEGQGIDPDHGVLRLSFVHYTHEDEVQKLITTLDKIL